uniref:Uncharacterized protein n=1 Tax=Arundo donax TaxID=35708 RepID=A0A0A9A7R2_ARUDO
MFYLGYTFVPNIFFSHYFLPKAICFFKFPPTVHSRLMFSFLRFFIPNLPFSLVCKFFSTLPDDIFFWCLPFARRIFSLFCPSFQWWFLGGDT